MGKFSQRMTRNSRSSGRNGRDSSPHLVFDRRADKVTKVFLGRDNQHQATPELEQELVELPNIVSELLMLHDGICFNVYGENLTIPVLIRAFGVKGLMELLDQGAIKFFLESSVITYMVSEVPGVFPLASGRMSDSLHTDPSASVDFALDGLVRPPDGATLRRLSQRLSDAYIAPPSDFAPTTVKFVQDSYKKGRLSKVGLSPDVELERLNLAERKELCGFAQQLFDLCTMSELSLESVNEFRIMEICDESFRNLVDARRVVDSARTVFQIENVPHLSAMFAEGFLNVGDVARLRQDRHTVQFRRWLRNAVERADASEMSRAYIDAVSRKGSFFESRKGKLLKSLGVWGVSAGIGTVVAGPVGAVVGGALGQLIEPGVDAGLSLVDEFFLDGMIKGWQPRNYVEKVIRPAVLKNQTGKG